MSTISKLMFGYYQEGTPLCPLGRFSQAIPVLGSVISIITGIWVVCGKSATACEASYELTASYRIQLGIRAVIGLVPVVGLALIPIDLIATIVDIVRHHRNNTASPVLAKSM